MKKLSLAFKITEIEIQSMFFKKTYILKLCHSVYFDGLFWEWIDAIIVLWNCSS